MECRKLRDCRPKLPTATWKDDQPAIAWDIPEARMLQKYLYSKQTRALTFESFFNQWVTRNILPEKDIGTGAAGDKA